MRPLAALARVPLGGPSPICLPLLRMSVSGSLSSAESSRHSSLSPPRLCVFELFSPSSPLVRTTRDSTWINQTLAGRRAGVGRRGVRRLSRHPRAACLDWRGRIGLLLEVKESQIPGDDLLSSARLPWGTRAHTPGLSSSAVQWWLHSFPSKLSQSGTPSIGQVQTEFSGEPSATTPETKQ